MVNCNLDMVHLPADIQPRSRVGIGRKPAWLEQRDNPSRCVLATTMLGQQALIDMKPYCCSCQMYSKSMKSFGALLGRWIVSRACVALSLPGYTAHSPSPHAALRLHCYCVLQPGNSLFLSSLGFDRALGWSSWVCGHQCLATCTSSEGIAQRPPCESIHA